MINYIIGYCSLYFHFFLYHRSPNLQALNFILFVSSHMNIFCKSFCVLLMSSKSFIPGIIRVSSAKHDTVEFVIQLFISDICIRNRRGPTLIIRYATSNLSITSCCSIVRNRLLSV